MNELIYQQINKVCAFNVKKLPPDACGLPKTNIISVRGVWEQLEVYTHDLQHCFFHPANSTQVDHLPERSAASELLPAHTMGSMHLNTKCETIKSTNTLTSTAT